MTLDEDTEFDLLKRRAADMGLYCNKHKNYDPGRHVNSRSGAYYINALRQYPGEEVQSFVRYSSIAACHDFLSRYQRQQSGA